MNLEGRAVMVLWLATAGCGVESDDGGATPSPECETLDAAVVDASDGSDAGGGSDAPVGSFEVVGKLRCTTVLDHPGDPFPTPEFVLERDENGK